MLEALANAERDARSLRDANIMVEGLLRHQRQDLDRARECMETTAKVLGEHFVAFARRRLNLFGDPGYAVNLPLHVATREFAASVTAYLLRSDVSFNEAAQCTHVLVSWKEHRAAYAISEQAMCRLDDQTLMRKIVPDLTSVLLRQIRECRQCGRGG